jgi:hypothetical protein
MAKAWSNYSVAIPSIDINSTRISTFDGNVNLTLNSFIVSDSKNVYIYRNGVLSTTKILEFSVSNSLDIVYKAIFSNSSSSMLFVLCTESINEYIIKMMINSTVIFTYQTGLYNFRNISNIVLRSNKLIVLL